MDRNSALALFARADAMFREGNYAQSLAALRELIRCFPDNKSVLYAIALCLERLDCRAEAVQLCDRLVSEHHYDKAMILKARLVTTPGALSDDIMPVWPEGEATFEPVGEYPARATSMSSSPLLWYGGAGLVISLLVVLFAVFATYVAQADAALPGALPTLFPGRMLLGYLFFLFGSVTTTLYAVGSAGKPRAHPWRPNVGNVAGCGVLYLVPVAGWLTASAFMYKCFDMPVMKIIIVAAVSVILHIIGIAVVAYVLDWNNFTVVYMELRAGYG